jgi:hypothetical protein
MRIERHDGRIIESKSEGFLNRSVPCYVVLTIVFPLLVASCATSQQKPPDCRGDYMRINAAEKYPTVDNDSNVTGRTKDKR